MDRQTAIDRVVSAANNRNRTDWGNYLRRTGRIYGLSSRYEGRERRERNRRERIADQGRIPLAATKEQDEQVAQQVLAAQKSEELSEEEQKEQKEQKREQNELDRLNDGYQSEEEDSDRPDEEYG